MSRTSYNQRRRKTSDLVLSGVGTLTFDQRMRSVGVRSTRDALSGDWTAVGNDLRAAIGKTRREFEAA